MALQETHVRCDVTDAIRTSGRLQLTVRGANQEPESAGQLELTPEFTQRYELIRLLGRGASGMVFLARQRDVDRPVALKVLMRLETEDLTRFLAEGKLLARLSHPNIVRVYDLGMLGDHPYLACAYIEGGTLTERLARGRMKRDLALQAALDALAGLAACHEAGIIHRDVKPDNILFDSAGTALVADLGIARNVGRVERLTRTGALIGTPIYMAPEQIQGEEATAASDVYAVGQILLEMLTGRPAFPAKSLLEVIDAKAKPLRVDRNVLPNERPAVIAAIASAVALRADRRPRTAQDLHQRLQNAMREESAVARKRAPDRAKREIVLALVALVLFAVGAGAWGWLKPIHMKDHKVFARHTSARVWIDTDEQAFIELAIAPVAGGAERIVGSQTRVPCVSQGVAVDQLTPGTRYRVEARLSNGGRTSYAPIFEFSTMKSDPIEPARKLVDELRRFPKTALETQALTLVRWRRAVAHARPHESALNALIAHQPLLEEPTSTGQAILFCERGKFREALAVLDEVLVKRPHDARAHAVYVVALDALDRGGAPLLEHVRGAFDADPETRSDAARAMIYLRAARRADGLYSDAIYNVTQYRVTDAFLEKLGTDMLENPAGYAMLRSALELLAR